MPQARGRSRTGRRRKPQQGNKKATRTLLASAAALVLVWKLVTEYPGPSVVVGLLLLFSVAFFLVARHRRRREAALVQRERDRQIALTDGMSGRDFEHWTARLLHRSGCVDVQVVGGAGDAGMDLIARSPSGRRVVVQCKRYNHLTAKVTSPEVQRFAGTARFVHHAEIALMVTTTAYTAPARELAHKAGITLVDRGVLAEWARTGEAPSFTGLLAGTTW